MSDFRGILQISGSQSSVNGDLLLMSGDTDPDQAMSDATSFVKRKGFQSGFDIVVTGSMGQVGTVSGIIMTGAATPPAAAPAATVRALARTANTASPARKKAAPRKKKPASGKKKSRPKKAKARTARGKTGKSKRNR